MMAMVMSFTHAEQLDKISTLALSRGDQSSIVALATILIHALSVSKRSNDESNATALRRAVQEFVRGFGLLDETATPCGLPLHTSQAHALMILLEADEDGLHQAALARQLGIDKSNTSRLVHQLTKKRLVAVTAAPEEDARIKRVRLTTKGARLAASVDASSRGRFAELVAAVEPAHRRTVIEGLEHLTRALERSRHPIERKRA
jgi:DNA-binding MarR family transcriptional regulator